MTTWVTLTARRWKHFRAAAWRFCLPSTEERLGTSGLKLLAWTLALAVWCRLCRLLLPAIVKGLGWGS